ncbi:MAG: bifunctional 5,10-methylenetetrahydrofolate dehydrogenase/5,10-methenyltetrahydrofolate cyclohydrolase, partial [Lachnospiraceae bacterium]|nr:bifunctional 5,10-methylenetetrahydrofolate dehydrogenase/5,10-methenyltetrahydrofolate cyclohydrolase [Lachnospiraceae bacterium]
AEHLRMKIKELNEDAGVHGVLLFRPLPKHLKPDADRIENALVPEKDVDSMTDLSNAGVYEGKDLGFPPCTAEAVIKVLDHYGIDIEGKRVAVLGRSKVIGKPLAMMLMARNATITVCHRKTADIPSITRESDIIVSAVGEAKFLTGNYVREGQTVVDVSINWDQTKNDGRGGITGDAVFEEVAQVVDAVTPVPGGIGAVTTAVLMNHVVRAAERTTASAQSPQPPISQEK